MKHIIITLLFCLLATLKVAAADKLETDWLQAKHGAGGEALNAKVIGIETQGDRVTVDVALPVEQLKDYESVVVIGKRPKQPEPGKGKQRITLVKKPQWLHNDENEPYGLRFHVKGVPGFEFRIQLNAVEGKLLGD